MLAYQLDSNHRNTFGLQTIKCNLLDLKYNQVIESGINIAFLPADIVVQNHQTNILDTNNLTKIPFCYPGFKKDTQGLTNNSDNDILPANIQLIIRYLPG